MNITKTDFKLYLEAPLHLWALKHDQLERHAPTPFEQHLAQQGLAIEALAKDYLAVFTAGRYSHGELIWQPTYQDGEFEARADALIYDPQAQVYDIYEIKSSTSLKKEHEYDAAFQFLVCAANLPIRDVYLVHLNKEYTRQGELDIGAFFITELISERVMNLQAEVAQARLEALVSAQLPDPAGIPGCSNPGSCVCPGLCHPGLPDYPIYDLPRIGKKALELKGQGILSIAEIPDDYPLSPSQKQQVQLVKQGRPQVNQEAIRQELDRLVYPLYFLDYETFNPGIPLFDGYHPYQHIVYQYSLHVLANPTSQLEHFELLLTGPGDPVKELLESLASLIGSSGSVVVWFKNFETGRNKDMAEICPEFGDFLLSVNERIYDLMEIFSQGYYLHPEFRGSASLKSVLPVLVPELSYAGLPISSGEVCMLAWWKLYSGALAVDETESTKTAMLKYCETDTLAMVKIWEKLFKLGMEGK
ncbi:MAG TPA: DUF2779 domain-containing protein [Anaerolineales bacterium]|nr:DUF2779 domain-containing protein [Anaerolineales bacterium]